MILESILENKVNSILFIQKLFERTNTGFFAKDVNGNIISTNTFMLSVYGVRTESEVIGKTDFDFFPSYIAEPITQDDHHVLNKGEQILDRIEMVPFIDFKLYWLQTSKYPVLDDQGKTIGLIGITTKLKESGGHLAKSENLIEVLTHIEDNIDKKLSLDELSEIAKMSKTSLLRQFKETFNISPIAYIKKVRFHLACKMLRNSDKDLLSIAYACGYHDQSHFNKEFKAMLNTTPRKYKLDITKSTNS